jgi:hypothetical protein
VVGDAGRTPTLLNWGVDVKTHLLTDDGLSEWTAHDSDIFLRFVAVTLSQSYSG